MNSRILTEQHSARARWLAPACALAGLLALAGCGGSQAPAGKAAAVQGGAPPAAVRQGAAGATAYNSAVQDIYIAYFGRPADPGGLAWYADLLASAGAGASRQEVIAAYNTSGTVRDLIDSFGNSAESQALYGGTNAQFITSIYTNLFNRLPDAAGLNYWTQQLNNRQVTRAAAAIAIMGGALTSDAAIIAAKNQVATSFTSQITDPRQYNGLEAGAIARTMLAAVNTTQDPSTVQQRVLDALRDTQIASGWLAGQGAAQSGIFVDAPVSGLSYSAAPSGAVGKTDAMGYFSYAAGDTVTFSAAGVTLGSTSRLAPDATRGNPAVVTPVDLMPTAADATNPYVTAIAQWLAGLNSVAVAFNQGASGAFKLPVTTGVSGPQAPDVTALLGAASAAQTTILTLPAALASGGVLQNAIQAAGGQVMAPSAVQDNLRQAQNSARYIGSFWVADCPQCNNGAGATLRLYLNANGVVRGFGKIDIGDASDATFDNTNGLIGTWQAETGANGGVTISVVSPSMYLGANGAGFYGYYLQGRLSDNAGTAIVYDSSGSAVSSEVTFARMAAATGAKAAYVGNWKLSIDTVTAEGRQHSYVPSSGNVLMGPDGQVYLYDAKGIPNAPWDMAGGVASPIGLTRDSLGDLSCQAGNTYTDNLSINLAAGTAALSATPGYALLASGSVARTGLTGGEVYTDMQDNARMLSEIAAEVRVPFALNADIHWQPNPAGQGAVTSLVLGVLLTGHGRTFSDCAATGLKVNTFGLRPVINPLGYGANAATQRDTFAVDYLQGQPENYQVMVVGAASHYCSVTQNGSGAVVTTKSGKPDAYPTVQVTCNR